MKRRLLLYTFVAALGGLLFGFDTAVINGALPFLRAHFGLTDAMLGWTVSSALIGCILGAPLVGKPGDRFGRRTMLRVLALLFLLSALGSGLAASFPMFVASRFVGGLAIGGASVLSPMYISEIAPPAYRGRLAISFQLAIVTGILLAFFSDYLLLNTGTANWRWMFIVAAVPSAVFFVLLFFVRRSPRWLVKAGRLEEAREVIEEVNPGEDAAQMVRDIQASIDREVMARSVYLFRPPYRRLVLIGVAIGFFNQVTGINVIMYYATDIFRSAGFDTSSAIGQTVIIGVTNLVFTLAAMRVIDRIGRKRLLLVGSLGMAVFLALFAWAYLGGHSAGFTLLALLVGFIAFFAFSQGAVIWVLLAEMFPNNIRARGSAIGSFSHWFFNGATSFLFPVVAGSFAGGRGTGYAFAFYALATFLGFFFYRKYVFETRGQSLEALEKVSLRV